MTAPHAISYPQVASRLFGQPLLIEQRKLNTILRVLSPRMGFAIEGQDDSDSRQEPLPPAVHTARLQGSKAQRRDEGHWVSGGVAIIPIIGSLVQRGGYVGYSGLTSYDAIERMFDVAMADPAIRTILFEIDSPGGEVSGAFDLAEKIYQARSHKRLVASVSELAASGGYLLASAASEISVPRTGYVGSIGVVTAHVDYSESLKLEGVAVTFIYAGDKKVDGNPYEPLSERAHKDIHQDVRDLYSLFVDTIARNRGIKAAAVQGTQAGMYLGRAGIDAGLADRINSFSNEFANASLFPAAVPGRQQLSPPSLTEKTMSEIATNTAPQTPAAVNEAAVAQARAEGHQTGLKDGASAERTRIESILSHADAQGRESTAQHLAFKTDMAAESAVALMQSTPKTQTTGALATAMNRLGATGVCTDPDTATATDKVVAIDTNAIYRQRAQRCAPNQH